MPLCDGCGAQVDEAHIRRRIERLELATRFRPIHIQVLLLDAAPLPAPEDDFYRTGSEKRSIASQMFCDEISKCVGRKPGEALHDESTLAEFQRRGFYLAYAVECPVESSEQLAAAVSKLASRVLLRVNTSYKPKFVAPISQALQPLIALFQSNSWADRLILHEGKPFHDPFNRDPQHHAEFGAALGDRLTKALAHHS